LRDERLALDANPARGRVEQRTVGRRPAGAVDLVAELDLRVGRRGERHADRDHMVTTRLQACALCQQRAELPVDVALPAHDLALFHQRVLPGSAQCVGDSGQVLRADSGAFAGGVVGRRRHALEIRGDETERIGLRLKGIFLVFELADAPVQRTRRAARRERALLRQHRRLSDADRGIGRNLQALYVQPGGQAGKGQHLAAGCHAGHTLDGGTARIDLDLGDARVGDRLLCRDIEQAEQEPGANGGAQRNGRVFLHEGGLGRWFDLC
jgi:hypothetical protein